jgi:hypothetical protein
MGKVVELFGVVCIVVFTIIGIMFVAGFFFDGMHRTVVYFVTDSLFFCRQFVR